MPDGLIPMWVADMDFTVPDEVVEDIQRAVSHGVFGYTEPKQDYYSVVAGWFRSHFSWDVRESWISTAPGVVFALAQAICALTEKGGGVLIMRPVYYPFTTMIEQNGRRVVNSPLINDGGKYAIDFDDFERKIVDNDVKLFVLCSPHNPVGRVWTEAELTRVAEICLKHGVPIVSDEIHCDFTFDGIKHTPLASLSPEIAANTVTLTAPSKTFNLAGMNTANTIIPNPELKKKYDRQVSSTGFYQNTSVGRAACKSAYAKGEPWLEELLPYLSGSFDMMADFIREKLPRVKFRKPEGTYLAWLDFSDYAFAQDELDRIVIDKAKLWLDTGTMFGEEGKGFQRVNIATPRCILMNAMQSLAEAFN
jgi:cystathionine beta-lyase